MGKLFFDRRGASLVEYLMLVGLVALFAAAGLRTFGQRVLARIEAQAACIVTFACSDHAADEGSSSSGDEGPRPEPPIPTRDQVLAAIERANTSGDLHALDSVDRFRQRLTPELQAEYDALLDQLRDDDRIDFVYQPGVTASAGRDDLVLRGIAAAAFGNPELLEGTIQTAVDSRQDASGQVVEDGHGALELIIYPGAFPLGTYYPGNTGDVPGLVTPTSDVVISESYLYDTIAAGEHLLIHEFSHSLQQASDDGDVAQQRHYPEDFDEEDLVDDATANDPELNAYILDRFGAVPTNLEVFPTLQVIFESDPAALQAASPEVYEAFVEYHGFDPLTGRRAG